MTEGHFWWTGIRSTSYTIESTEFMAVNQRARNSEPPAFLDFYASHGPKPEIKHFQSMEEIIESVAEHVKKWVKARVGVCSDIAILYTVRATRADDGEYLPWRFGEAL